MCETLRLVSYFLITRQPHPLLRCCLKAFNEETVPTFNHIAALPRLLQYHKLLVYNQYGKSENLL